MYFVYALASVKTLPSVAMCLHKLVDTNTGTMRCEKPTSCRTYTGPFSLPWPLITALRADFYRYYYPAVLFSKYECKFLSALSACMCQGSEKLRPPSYGMFCNVPRIPLCLPAPLAHRRTMQTDTARMHQLLSFCYHKHKREVTVASPPSCKIPLPY